MEMFPALILVIMNLTIVFYLFGKFAFYVSLVSIPLETPKSMEMEKSVELLLFPIATNKTGMPVLSVLLDTRDGTGKEKMMVN